jgi:hypothetical protein
VSFQKEPQWRSAEYLAWVRSQPCRGCGVVGVLHAHHNIAHRYGSSKASDLWALPMCPKCHALLHSDWPAWEESNNTQDRHCLITLNAAAVAGVLELNKRKALLAA